MNKFFCWQVYGYRMSLWREHLGILDDCFEEPHNLSCVRRVNEIADENWARYKAEPIVPLQGHILKYPIKVKSNGEIGTLPGQECFPDVRGKILGEPSATIPAN